MHRFSSQPPPAPGRRAARAAWAAALLPVLAVVSWGCSRAEPAQKMAAPVVEVEHVIQQDVPITREWVGTLDGSVNAEIRPQVEGYLLRRVYQEGAYVAKGALLFEIDPRQFQAALDQAQAEVTRAEAALAKADLDVRRFTPLAADKAISQEELDTALSTQRQARANVSSAQAAVERARLNLGWTKVVSPIGGIAGIAKAQVGDLVNGQTTMTIVSTVDPIKAYFDPSEQEYMSWLQGGGTAGSGEAAAAAASDQFQLILSDGSVYPERGELILTDRNVNVKTGTITVAAAFPNPARRLRPGQYARIRTVTEVRRGALLVPQRAVSELQGTYQVAVVDGENKVDFRAVQTGARVGRLWVIDKGLSAGETVVVEGLQKIRPGLTVTPKPFAPEVHADAAGVAAAAPAGAKKDKD